MPTGYTAPVQDGTITDVSEFAAKCARAFGAFIHQRDDSSNADLTYPESPYNSFYERSLRAARFERKRWTNLSEEAKYNEWSDYYNEKVKAGIKAKAKHDVERTRYKAMIAQVEAVDVPEALGEFKEFMLEQLNSSINFDCPENDEFTHKWYTPLSYGEWCEEKENSAWRNITYYKEQVDKDWERYNERCDYIDLMAKTFEFKVKGARHARPQPPASIISG